MTIAMTFADLRSVITDSAGKPNMAARKAGFYKTFVGRDKVAKLARTSAALAGAISEKCNGSDHKRTIQARRASKFLGDARDVFSIMGVYADSPMKIHSAAKKTYEVASALRFGKEVHLSGRPKDDSEPLSVKQRFDKIESGSSGMKLLALVEQIGSGIGGITHAIGFGICRLIKQIGAIIGQLSAGAKKLVKLFPIFMCITHFAGVVRLVASLVRRFFTSQKLVKEQGFVDQDWEAASRFYTQKTTEDVLSLAETGCEIVGDARGVFGAQIPMLPLAIVGFTGSLFSIAKAWISDYKYSPAPAPR